MTKIFMILFFVALGVLGLSSVCFAWGPGVHMAIGNAVIARPELLPMTVARLLAANSAIYLYGCLSADIFIGKGSKAKKKHSHNWQTGFDILNAAARPHLKAYALGYLSHLAADIVAHNYYVPNIMCKAQSGSKLSHIYIEMLADRHANWSAEQAMNLFKSADKEADLSLRSCMESRKLTFSLKKRAFHQTIGLLEYKAVTKSLSLSKKMAPAYQDEELQSSLDYSYRLVLNLLPSPYKATALQFDPIGSDHLATAKVETDRFNIMTKQEPLAPRFELARAITDLPQDEGFQSLLRVSL